MALAWCMSVRFKKLCMHPASLLVRSLRGCCLSTSASSPIRLHSALGLCQLLLKLCYSPSIPSSLPPFLPPSVFFSFAPASDYSPNHHIRDVARVFALFFLTASPPALRILICCSTGSSRRTDLLPFRHLEWLRSSASAYSASLEDPPHPDPNETEPYQQTLVIRPPFVIPPTLFPANSFCSGYAWTLSVCVPHRRI